MTAARRCLTKEEVVQKGLAIDTGLCCTCGLCAAICPVGALSLTQQPEDEPLLSFRPGCNACGICYAVCPGKHVPLRDLDKYVFGRERDLKTEILGVMTGCYQANASASEIRARGASGGVATALLVYALEKAKISAATVVAFDREHPWKAVAALATSREEIVEAANSKYVIVPVCIALTGLRYRKLSGQVGFVGLPCQVHAIRKLQYHYPTHRLSKKIAFIIGIHCGANRPMEQTKHLLKNLGVASLDEVKSLNYRKGKAPDAHVEVIKTNGEIKRIGKNDWGEILSFAGRCMLCWDWGAELSDVSVCDFFGPAAPNSDVHPGASTMIVRTPVGEQLVKGAVEAGYLEIHPTPAEPMIRSYGLIVKKFSCPNTLATFKKYRLPCPDYQYQIEPMGMLDKVCLSNGLSIEERERFWAQRDIYAPPQ